MGQLGQESQHRLIAWGWAGRLSRPTPQRFTFFTDATGAIA